jgi:uncharacterized LabA/DUF88 family protein
MQSRQTERIALFIDGANLYAGARALGFDVDYKRLLAHFRQQGRLQRAIFFTVLQEDQDYSPVRPLLDWLEYNGFLLVTKPAKEFTDALGRRKLKGSIDVDLAVAAMRISAAIDRLILFSGDGCFRCLVEALQQMGKCVSVVSALQTHPCIIADELRRQADEFIDLADLKAVICRDVPRRPDRAAGAREAPKAQDCQSD